MTCFLKKLSASLFRCQLMTVAFVFAAVTSAAYAKRPNVILIMTDNHGAWTLGCYGNRDIRSPNIDRLATEGTLFTRAFASNPVCSPTRATFLTGLVPSQHGVHSFLAGGRLQTGPDARCTLDTVTSLPEVLRDQGYSCGLVGKWHLGGNMTPQEGLDDYWITMPHGGTSTFYGGKIIENGKQRIEPKYMTDLWTEHAVKFIDQKANDDEPFFLFLAYNGPYSLSRLLLREGQNRHAEYYADKQLSSFPREKPHPWQLNNLDFINNPVSIRRVATEVSGVDDGVGTVMETLKKRGIDEDTLVIFVADQGWVGGHGGFFGMGDHTRPLTARDGMMLIPTIWRHPGNVTAGKRSDRMITNYDLMPTLLSYLGMSDQKPTSPALPGEDYTVDLKTKEASKSADRPIFYEFENLRCIRTTQFKYVHRHPNGPHELYDLASDPDEYHNLVGNPKWESKRNELKRQLTSFYDKYAVPKYDMWNGGTSQVRIHDGVDEELAQLVSVPPPPLPKGFVPPEINVPEGFEVELAAGPPLVTHPTMACFDDVGNLYVCNNAGVNMTNEQLESELPNSIVKLTDQDQDGRFDKSTVFADKMTFPMGGAWHEGALYVASPPNIWRLRDTNNDGIADERKAIVTEFGYNGNAASIHGCFFGPDGRMYWCDGFHGHEFKDDAGKVTSKREGSYMFSCRTDGSDVQIHCGGGMDNPVEVDFTESGDMLGTVNILYTRPRVDCFVHWLHGGAYPHREKVLNELKITGDFLGPAHRFGHVAVSGVTRYRSGAMNHQWSNDWFTTFFNRGKVVRLEVKPSGSTYEAVEHEFLSSTSREFHPTDVLEDADGSLLVIDTGGWFYRGCPTSQFAKPDLLGAIYRVRRTGMTPLVDPRGKTIDWEALTDAEVIKLLNDTRFEVRNQAINHCVTRGKTILPALSSMAIRADIRVRQNIAWALCRLAANESTSPLATKALMGMLADKRARIRQAACRALSLSVSKVDPRPLLPLLNDPSPSVQREAITSLGKIGATSASSLLLKKLEQRPERSLQHAIIYALIEIGDEKNLRKALASNHPEQIYGGLVAIDQMDGAELSEQDVIAHLDSGSKDLRGFALGVAMKNDGWSKTLTKHLAQVISDDQSIVGAPNVAHSLLAKYASDPAIGDLVGKILASAPSPAQRIVIDGLSGANDLPLNASWKSALDSMLTSSDVAVVRDGLAIAGALKVDQLLGSLSKLTMKKQLPASIRVQALRILRGKSNRLDEQSFELLQAMLTDGTSPSEANMAAEMIGQATLSPAQLTKVGTLISGVSPMQIRSLIRCFSRTRDPSQANAFLDSVGSAKSFLSLPVNELSDVIKRFPAETLSKANGLLDRLANNEQKKLARLSKLKLLLSSGDAKRGKKVFFSERAKCAACHRVGDQGKRIGPELTTIGANRSESDLLESIVLPSASIVRDYETVNVLTDEGRTISGVISLEKAGTLIIQQSTGQQVEVPKDEIEKMQSNPISIMPNGLEEALSEQDLADVVKYLKSLQQQTSGQ